MELLPYAYAPVFLKEPFSRSQLQKQLLHQNNEDNNTTEQERNYFPNHVLHPYLGFVNTPSKHYNQYGFPGPSPITQKSNDTINICITGGSVAMGLYLSSSSTLIQHLKKIDRFKNKEIKLILIALGGFKQPQQLLAINYFLTLGAHYDVVINLDGFNEITLPYSDNLPFNVHSSYPRNWNLYAKKGLNNNIESSISQQFGLKKEKLQLNHVFKQYKLYYSNFALLLWKVLSNKNKNSLYDVELSLRRKLSLIEPNYQSTGPEEEFTDTLQYFKKQAELWKRSSILMDKLGKQIHFDYFHFLQPNQYYKNSKKLTNKELTHAYENNPFNYKTAVQKGYPILIETGLEMKQNINYVDLTLLFKNESKTVYNDKCCHFNTYGYNLIAQNIAHSIQSVYQEK